MFSDDDPGGKREAGRQKRNEIIDCEYFTLYREQRYFNFGAENSAYLEILRFRITFQLTQFLCLSNIAVKLFHVCSHHDSTDSLHCCGHGQTPH